MKHASVAYPYTMSMVWGEGKNRLFASVKRVVLGGRVKGISNLRCKLELVPIGQNKPIPTEDFGMVHIGYHSNGKRRPVLRNKRRIHSPLKDRRGIIWSFFCSSVADSARRLGPEY